MKITLTNGKGGTASPTARVAFTWGASNGFTPYGQARPVQRAPRQQVAYVMRPADAAMSEDAEDAVEALIKLGTRRVIAADLVRKAVGFGHKDTLAIIQHVLSRQ